MTSLVNDVIMPPMGMLLGGVNSRDLAVTLNYGAFIQTVVDFLIVAIVISILVKGINTLRRKQEAKDAAM